MKNDLTLPSEIAKAAEDARVWDELLSIAAVHEISVEVHNILSSEESKNLNMSERLAKNQWLVNYLKRLRDIQSLFDSSANGFNEVFDKIKSLPGLDNERDEIIRKIRKHSRHESITERNKRLKQRMGELMSQGMSARDASKKLFAEEVAAGRKDLSPDSIRAYFRK